MELFKVTYRNAAGVHCIYIQAESFEDAKNNAENRHENNEVLQVIHVK